MRRLFYLFMLIVFMAGFSACQKDDSVKEGTKTLLKGDSSKIIVPLAAAAGNTLAVKGTLTVTVQDSTYTFDASKDSIAFVNVYLDGKNYFGITAINKEHTMTFGVSAPGYASSGINVPVAGSQFLISTEPPIQFSLSQHPDLPTTGSVTVDQFLENGVLAKGSFVTYLAKNVKTTSDFYLAKGTFALMSK